MADGGQFLGGTFIEWAVLDWGLMIRSSSKGQGQFSLEVCFVGLVVRRNYVWYIVIFVIFMGFGVAELGDALKTSFGLAMQATRGEMKF